MQSGNAAILHRGTPITTATILRITWLISIGLATVVLWNVKVPIPGAGHNGIIWMALLVSARMTSPYRWAATTAMTSAAGFSVLPGLGMGLGVAGGLFWLMFVVAGVLVDLLYMLPFFRSATTIALMAGLALTVKPIVRTLGSGLGLPYIQLFSGPAYPLLGHFVFGFFGGLAGAGIVLGARKLRQKLIGNAES
jgi:hypothetical protein